MKENIVLNSLQSKRSESVQKKRLDVIDTLGSSNNILEPVDYDVGLQQRPLCMTKSQPAHLLSPNMVKPRQNPNTKTALNTKLNASRQIDNSVNILERIQSKIEEKMTRAETSNG